MQQQGETPSYAARINFIVLWTTADLETKLLEFRDYFNRHRAHAGLSGRTPERDSEGSRLSVSSYRWQPHCRGLYHTPTAA
jgi:putative transposase